MKELTRSTRAKGRRVQDVFEKSSRMPRGILPSSLIGFAIAITCGLLLAFIWALIIYKTSDPTKLVIPSAFTALYISAFAGGVASTRLNNGSALLCGLCVGAFMLMASLALSLPITGALSSGYKLTEALALRSAIMVCSLIGAFTGVSRKPRQPKRKKHNKR